MFANLNGIILGLQQENWLISYNILALITKLEFFLIKIHLYSPRITGLTCISLVHTYVQTLPHDRFTKLVPFYEYEERDFQSRREMLFAGLGGGCSTKANVVCTLHMPHLTPYREPIQGNQLNWDFFPFDFFLIYYLCMYINLFVNPKIVQFS